MIMSFFSLKRIIFFVLLLTINVNSTKSNESNNVVVVAEISLYKRLQLEKLGLNQQIFDEALAGWNSLMKSEHIEKSNLLSIADMSQSSNAKRLYVIDMENKKVLFNTYVAHGRNSGEEFAASFANKNNSYKSSLGFYVTGNTYQGVHGTSMRLKGVEEGINDIAEQRGIVMHGASYVSESFIQQHGRLGRSQGCPAVPESLCKPIVEIIKEGSCFFMFYPDNNYLKHSKFYGRV